MKSDLLIKIFSRKMLVAFIMGFASGLPLLLTSTLLQAWLKDSQIDLSTIGLVSLLSLPYTLKFIWAPFLDCYSIPGFGRRKGWMLIFQLLLIGAIFGMGSSDPVRSPLLLGILAFTVAFFSASQDIVIEDLTDQELGLGSSLYVNGYRVGMLLASGGGLILSDHYSFGAVYYFMGLCLFVGVLATLLTPEPQIDTLLPASFRDAVILPFIDFLKRKEAFWILAFIVLYKIGDNMAATMTTPYYMEIGFTKTQIGAVVKLFGFWATIIGSLTGGIMMLKIGINKSLWIFGILQAVSTLCFGLLTVTGPDNWVLAGVIAFENLTGGMGTTAFVAFMLSLTNRAYTATQYALLSSFMGVPRVFAAAPTGYLAQAIGWWNFFVVCTLVALPGLLLLLVFAPFNKRQESYRSKIASFRKQG